MNYSQPMATNFEDWAPYAWWVRPFTTAAAEFGDGYRSSGEPHSVTPGIQQSAIRGNSLAMHVPNRAKGNLDVDWWSTKWSLSLR